MAELPRTPFNTSETKPIRYNLSAADIAGPYTEIARAADKASGALSDVSVPLAQEAASQVVRRDDSGNLIVDQLPPLFGDAAKTARLTIAAKLQPQIETDLLKQKLDHPNDPAGFMSSVSAYKPALLKGMDGQLGVGVDKMIDNTSQQYLRSLMVEKDNHDTSEFKDSMEAQITRINDQTQVLARQEGGPESPEYAGLVKERGTIIDAMMSHPKIRLSPEKAQLLKDEAHGNDMGQAIVGSTIRQFQTKKNKTEAQRYLMDWAWGEQGKNLPLTPRQRDHFVSEGLKSLETMSAEDRKAITASKANINGAVTGWMSNPEAFREAPFNDLLQAARAVGDDDGERQLHAFRNMQPVFSNLASQNSEDRANKVDLIQHLVKGELPGPAPDEAFTNAPGTPKPIDFSDAATAHIWDQAVTRARTWAAADAQKSYDDLKYSIDNRHPVSEERVKEFANLAVLGRKVDLLEKLRPDLARLVGRGEISREASSAVVSEARQVAATSPDPVAQRAADAIVKQQEADDVEMKKSPAQYAVDHYGANPLGPLVSEKPDAFTGEIANRGSTMAKFHQMEKEFGGAPWINEPEADQLYGQLTQTLKPEDAAAAVRTLAQIPDTDGDGLATLTQKKVMGAIRDMGYSADPVRMEASMKTQEELWQAHPYEYKDAYGSEAEHHLMTYQALRGAFNPAEIAAVMNRPVAGRDRVARKKIEDDAKTAMSSVDAEDVAYMMGSASTPQFTHIGRLTGATPSVPADAVTSNAFLTEFKEGVATIVGSGVDDVGKAKQVMAQKMAKEWSVSPLNNNTLMKYAPEKVYPELPGDPDGRWLHQQLEEHITSIMGPQFGYGAGEQTIPNWKFEKLIADPQSKYEAEHGKPVSYQVGISDENGQYQLLKGADGSTRFRFEPGKATDPTTPQGRAYEAKRIALEKSEKDLAARDAIQQRLYGFGRGSAAALKQLPPIDIPNMVRGAIGAPPLEAQSPAYNHDAHVEARDGGK